MTSYFMGTQILSCSRHWLDLLQDQSINASITTTAVGCLILTVPSLYLSHEQLKPTLADSCIGGWGSVRVLAKVNKAEVQVTMVAAALSSPLFNSQERRSAFMLSLSSIIGCSGSPSLLCEENGPFHPLFIMRASKSSSLLHPLHR